MVKRVAVIGAGCCGLACIKCCLDEGLEPICFESSDDIGGLWRFKEKPEPGRANIYRSVIINCSKEMMAYSDFPPPAEFSNHMHNTQVLKYLCLYADHYDLNRHIRLQTTVRSVKKRPDFASSGQWEIVTEKKDGQVEMLIFDAVMVSSGHYSYPHLPLHDFPGIESFKGKYFHSWNYRSVEGMQDKTVVVIGIGNSGADIAVEASTVAKQVYLSTRTGTWVIGRLREGGLPYDFVSWARLSVLWHKLMPSWTTKAVEKELNKRFDHKLYGLQPSYGFFTQIPVVNDDLPGRIMSGRLLIKPNVKEFSGSSVIFEDGTVVDEVDVVVFATGYNYDFPFLPEDLKVKEGYRLSLYKYVFPPRLEKPTLAVVGFIHGLGAIIPLAEMQARWATRVFKGLKKLPTEKRMLDEIRGSTKTMNQRFACTERSPLQVDYIPYMDDIASEVGAKPSFLSLLLRDPGLGLRVLFGPCTPYQYRLCGPGQWAGARQAIYSQWERVTHPFTTRRATKAELDTKKGGPLFITVGLLVVSLLCSALYLKIGSMF